MKFKGRSRDQTRRSWLFSESTFALAARRSCSFSTLFVATVPAFALAMGCASPGSIEREFAPAHAAASAAVPAIAGSEAEHWPLPPAELEQAFRAGRIEIVSEQYAGAGLTGAARMRLRLLDREGFELTAKWKPMPAGLDGINNSPRKELVAYEVQKLFLEPEDFVVPTSVARCIPIEQFPEPAAHRAGPLPGLNCELGVLSVWLENVKLPDVLFDPGRFASDPNYARHLANLNLLTFVILHQDGRKGNFLVSANESNRRVFAVDNGVAFSGMFYNWFVRNWKWIHVPALAQDSLEKLSRVTESEVESLATVLEMQTTPEGAMVSLTPELTRDRGEGVRIEGDRLQMGLDEDEIENLLERLEELREEVESGDIRTLPFP